MREELETEKKVSLAEALEMEMLINEALIAVLVEKGIFSHDEVMAKVMDIKLKQKGIIYNAAVKTTMN